MKDWIIVYLTIVLCETFVASLAFLQEICVLPFCRQNRPEEMQQIAENWKDPYVNVYFYIDVGFEFTIAERFGRRG